MRKKWVFAPYDKEKTASLAEQCGVSAFTALLLVTGGIDDPNKINAFLNTSEDFSDPFLLRDMDKAVKCILSAVDSGDRICVYGDYDADGVCATALLYSYLETVGADVIFYIPSRAEEGYGMNPDAVLKLKNSGVSLIVTVDNGISAFDAAEKAAELGIKLVITDHHKPGDSFPAAEAVVDPCRQDDNSGLSFLAGVGVAFKLVCALEGGVSDELLQEYSQTAAVGTVADLMPLRGENRKLVTEGLKQISSSPLPGIAALLEKVNTQGKELSSAQIAFGIAPRINAAGRMGSAEPALRLLLSETPETAAYYADELENCNNKRHEAERKITEEISSYLRANPDIAAMPVIVVGSEGWHEGVIGIAASKIVEKYGKPAVVITEKEDGTAKGSCRGIADFSIYDALRYCSDCLTNFGGHTSAAGLGIKSEDIDRFREKINSYAREHMPSAAELNIRCKLNPAGISAAMLDSLSRLEPYGEGNPKPIFALCSMEIVSVSPIGGGKHLRIELSRSGCNVRAVMFGRTETDMPFRRGDIVDVAAIIEKNEYNGRILPSVQIKSIRFSHVDEDKLFASYGIFRKIETGGLLSETERAAACPSRKLISLLYRYIKSGKAESDEEVLLHRLGCNEIEFCRVAVAVKALEDGGLITRGGGMKITENAKKTDLASIPILARLGYKE